MRLLVVPCLLLFGSATPVGAQDWFPPATVARGNVDAPLQVVEFSDFECPFCAAAKPVIDSLFALHGDDVRFEFRHYPLPSHQHADRAAEAAVEAAQQGAFWEYHNALYDNQKRLTDVDLLSYADSLGLDTEAFRQALEGGTHESAIQGDVEMGIKLAVTATPTFFVNGYRLVGVPSLWVFEEAIRAAKEGRLERRPLEPVRPPGR